MEIKRLKEIRKSLNSSPLSGVFSLPEEFGQSGNCTIEGGEIYPTKDGYNQLVELYGNNIALPLKEEQIKLLKDVTIEPNEGQSFKPFKSKPLMFVYNVKNEQGIEATVIISPDKESGQKSKQMYELIESESPVSYKVVPGAKETDFDKFCIGAV
jgi:hypothetical protein